ncbi:suppressor of fused domain protein [Sphingobacterium cellulitidis]|uniref:suppressor of fused domain protein n=1 Tax=Sphingobacterium cellulitidis TaxID=1768011 RepID=UPI00370D6191
MISKEEYIEKYNEDTAVGWLSIDEQLDRVYSGIEPRHYGPLCGLHFAAGGTDPIDGISVYDNQVSPAHLHLVTYGMSELYFNPESAGKEFSKWGFEFTFRLVPYSGDEGDPGWVMQVFNNLARYVYQSGRWFEENQFIPAKGPIRLNTETDIVGFATTLDPQLGRISTPHGEVSFIQLVGITQKELDYLMNEASTDKVAKFIEEMKESNPLLVTDLNRK